MAGQETDRTLSPLSYSRASRPNQSQAAASEKLPAFTWASLGQALVRGGGGVPYPRLKGGEHVQTGRGCINVYLIKAKQKFKEMEDKDWIARRKRKACTKKGNRERNTHRINTHRI